MSGTAATVGTPITTHISSPNDDRRIDQTYDDVQGTCWTRFTHSFKSTTLSTNIIFSCFGLPILGNNRSHQRQRRRLKRKRKGKKGRNERSTIPLVTTTSMNNGYNNVTHNPGEEGNHAPHQPGQTANPTLTLSALAETPQRMTSNRLRKSRRQKQASVSRTERQGGMSEPSSSNGPDTNNGSIANGGVSTAAGDSSQLAGRKTPILLPLSTPTGSRNATPATTPVLEQLIHWTSQPRKPVEPFPIHLPDDILRMIFEFAAADLDTACALCLVASHVRLWIDSILYRRVRLEGVVAIGLFARTVREAFIAGAEVDSIRDAVDRAPRMISPNVINVTTPVSQSRMAARQIQKRASFFANVYSLSIIPQEERVLLFFRDILRDAILILFACTNVVELETSGDFLRRTGVGASVELAQSTFPSVLPTTGPDISLNIIPNVASAASISTSTPNAIGTGPVSLGGTTSAIGNDNEVGENDDQSLNPSFYTPGPPTPTPANISLGTTPGAIDVGNSNGPDSEGIGTVVGSSILPVNLAVAPSGSMQAQSTSNSTEMFSSLNIAGTSSAPTPGMVNAHTSIERTFPTQQWLQLEQAALRPRYLTLVPPTLNVNFKLPILSTVTHLHYSAALPRALNAFGVGEGLNFDPATGGVNVAGSNTGRGTSLQLLTHVAFDYPLGVTGVKAETLLVLVRSALDVGKPLGWENEGQLLDESDSEDVPFGTDDDPDPFQGSNDSGDQTPPLGTETPRRRLKMVIVRILLRPRMKTENDRTSEVGRQLSELAARDERLVFFESPGLFGEDIWEKANAIVSARDSGRLSMSWYRESL